MNHIPPDLVVQIGLNILYLDLISLATCSKRFHTILTTVHIWKLKGKVDFPDLYDYWRTVEPFSTFSEQKYYLWLFSQENVTRGSEQFKSLNLCLNRTIGLNDSSLTEYFLGCGANWTTSSIKKLAKYGMLEPIKQLMSKWYHRTFRTSFVVGAQYGHKHIIDYLLEFETGTPRSEKLQIVLNGALKGKRDDVILHYNLGTIEPSYNLETILYYCAKTQQDDKLQKYFKLVPNDKIVQAERRIFLGKIRGCVDSVELDMSKYFETVNTEEIFNFVYECLAATVKANNIKWFNFLLTACEKCGFWIDHFKLKDILHLAFRYGRQYMVSALLNSSIYEKVLNKFGFGFILNYLIFTGFCPNVQLWKMVKMVNELARPEFSKFVAYDYHILADKGHNDFAPYYITNSSPGIKAKILCHSVLCSKFEFVKMCASELTKDHVLVSLETIRSSMSDSFYQEVLSKIYG